MKSTIRLFKAVPILEKKGKVTNHKLLQSTIKHGFVFAPEVIFNYSEKELEDLTKTVIEEVGLSAEEMNSSFHKSWKKVRDSSLEQLVLEQLIHYFTTYGFEALGIYSKDSVYIPNEKLEIPELDIDGFNFIIIKGYTKAELKKKIITLLSTGIAVSDETKRDIVDVCLFVEISSKEIEEIKNKEVRITLFDFLDMIPENPVEFLRYAVYKSIGKTLLIKDKATIEQIKEQENFDVLSLFYKYKNAYRLERLSEIFYRFKPIFLAFKTNTQLKSYINKIGRQAKKYHKPMKPDFLNDVTSMIKKGELITKEKLNKELSKVNTFRKIRLAYALHYRTKDVESILYKVRNGKSYAKEFDFEHKADAEEILEVVKESIINDIRKNVKGKTIYIPEYIKYTLPATEKQFTGDLPSGSYITIPKDMIFGVYWHNVGNHRIDLDLSIMRTSGRKVGWDVMYRTEDRGVLFSGDMTDAPNPKGASELFYIKRQTEDSMVMFINYFNYSPVTVPFKIIVAKEELEQLEENHMVNPNNVVCIAKTQINQKQKILGLIKTTPDECRFYFCETGIGNTITSSSKPYVEYSRNYLTDFYEDMFSLNDILEQAGARINEKEEGEEYDIDLSPENLEKDKIISLLS